MNVVFSYLLMFVLLAFNNDVGRNDEETPSVESPDDFHWISETFCNSSFNGEVKTFTLNDNLSTVGHSIWINRASQRVNAKYFAHTQNGSLVHTRYEEWKEDKQVVLMSSGAYATPDGLPAGITVDNGVIVNRAYEAKMDGLVIIYATGGIVVSNVEKGDLYLAGIGTLNIKNYVDRTRFLRWAKNNNATVFQTHLLAYDNQLQFVKPENKVARRKFLILAKAANGDLFHIIFYFKYKDYTLYSASKAVLSYLSRGKLDVVSIINLDTGTFDIINTGGDAKDCRGDYIIGNRNDLKKYMTNLLSYEYE